MTGATQTQNLFTVYQYDPPASSVMEKVINPKRILVSDQEINSQNISLFERPVLFITRPQMNRLPAHIRSNKAFMDFFIACSLMIPFDDLPTIITPREKSDHIYNSQESLRIFYRLANNGFPPAQHFLGLCSLIGDRLPQNTDNAFYFIQAAAAQGYAPAQVSLGHIYENGIGAPINYDYAISLYQAAANQGSPLAFYLLGACYEYGSGVPIDLRRASEFYSAASHLNFVGAKHAIRTIYTKILFLQNRPLTLVTPPAPCHPTPAPAPEPEPEPAPTPKPKLSAQKRKTPTVTQNPAKRIKRPSQK